MRPGDYACFPAGQRVGHSFLNSGTGPCSYLMIGERSGGDVCVMPDSNMMQVGALRTERSIFDIWASGAIWTANRGEQGGSPSWLMSAARRRQT
jgi:uncharacterized cupin superfamily protein